MSNGYWELSVAVPADASEGFTNFVWELGALGVVEEEIEGRPRLRAFFPETVAPAPLEARVRAYAASLRELGFALAGVPSVASLADENWAEAWHRYFLPTPVARTLLIAPPWDTPPANGRVVITIEPGRAFGTGQHGSTVGCLQCLESTIDRDRPPRGLDLGTGSGILAIAAARLGVGAMLAVDVDPDAVAAAVANAARNHVSDRVRCLLGDVGSLQTPPTPLVVANLLSAAHLALAARYRRHVAPGGTLILGGILDAEAAGVAETVEAAGFARRDSVSIDGWTALELRRQPVV
jgi:ribosomal protein L11 methyltransferase